MNSSNLWLKYSHSEFKILNKLNNKFKLIIIMILENIIIIIICVIASICLILFINRDKLNLNCCKNNCVSRNSKYTNYAVMDIDKINDNIKLMKSIDQKGQENELL